MVEGLHISPVYNTHFVTPTTDLSHGVHTIHEDNILNFFQDLIETETMCPPFSISSWQTFMNVFKLLFNYMTIPMEI